MRGLYLQLSCLFPLVGSLPAQLPPRPAPLDTVGERLWGCQPAVLRSLRFYMLPGTAQSHFFFLIKKQFWGPHRAARGILVP